MRGGHVLPSDGTRLSSLTSLLAHQLTSCCIFQRFKSRKFGKFRLLELFPDRTIKYHEVCTGEHREIVELEELSTYVRELRVRTARRPI